MERMKLNHSVLERITSRNTENNSILIENLYYKMSQDIVNYAPSLLGFARILRDEEYKNDDIPDTLRRVHSAPAEVGGLKQLQRQESMLNQKQKAKLQEKIDVQKKVIPAGSKRPGSLQHIYISFLS